MPWGLTRFHHSGQTHFVTFCCYHRLRLLTTDARCRTFESALERVRRSYRLYVFGYVIMPEHVHLLLSEPQPEGGPLQPEAQLQPEGGPLKPGFGLSGDVNWLSNTHLYTLADALKSLKQGVSRRLIEDTSVTNLFVPQLNCPTQARVGLEWATGTAPLEHFWQKRYYDFNVRNHEQFVEKLRYIHRNPVKAGLCERPEEWEWSSFRHHATGVEGRVQIESEWTSRKRERDAGRLCSAVDLPHSSQNRA